MIERSTHANNAPQSKSGAAIDVDAERDVNLDLGYNVQDERLNAIVRQMGLTRLRKVQAVAIQRGLFFRRSLLSC